MDQGFPLIQYDVQQSPREWGQKHGESFRAGIHELAAIRKKLMLSKNPDVSDERLHELAEEKWQITSKFNYRLSEELAGIAEGANLSRTNLIILNNYTDFRDLLVEDQGCSTVYFKSDSGTFAGQTWDMHGSAKDYVAVIEVPETEETPAMAVFTLVGCLGMAGMNAHGQVVGVNNLPTRSQSPGAIWPALIRHLLEAKEYAQMETEVQEASVSSGRALLLGGPDKGQLWEVTSNASQKVGEVSSEAQGAVYHTNHCLGEVVRESEIKGKVSSTTYPRYEILEKRVPSLENQADMLALLKGHENFPKSICGHYDSGIPDPSFTCGGFVTDIHQREISLWRGCQIHDANYGSYTLKFG